MILSALPAMYMKNSITYRSAVLCNTASRHYREKSEQFYAKDRKNVFYNWTLMRPHDSNAKQLNVTDLKFLLI